MPNPTTPCVSKSEFYKLLGENGKSKSNYLTCVKYRNLIRQVKKAKKSLLPKYERILKNFDVVKNGNKEKLIYPRCDGTVYYIKKTELFGILEEAHLNTGHGNRSDMINYLQKKYKNVSYESVKTYLQLSNCAKPASITNYKQDRPIAKTKTVGLVDLINMDDFRDGDYCFIFVYRDKKTKFVQLKPLRDSSNRELSSVMMDIFSSFGAPTKIEGDSCFAAALEELKKKWNGPVVKHETQQTDLSSDIRNLLNKFIYNTNMTKWSESLRFVQYVKNLMFDEEIKKSPFEAMFGRKGKLDVTNLSLPEELIKEMRLDEEEANDIEINNMLEVIVQED